MANLQQLESELYSIGFNTYWDGLDLAIEGIDTDGDPVTWFIVTYTGDLVVKGNTDQLNIWLCDNPAYDGITPDDILYLLAAVSKHLNDPVSVQDLVDPEDWQELASVSGAFDDPRYTALL